MEVEYKTSKNKSYLQRFATEFFPYVAVVTIISLLAFKMTDINYLVYIITGYSIIWGIFTHYMVRHSVSRISISDGEILISGTNINTKWDESSPLENTSVTIKSQGYGKGNVEYYLKINSPKATHIINKRKEWDYDDLIKIYGQINKSKTEINQTDKELLKKMKMKARGIHHLK